MAAAQVDNEISTPLLITCRSGSLEGVTYLLNKCHANVDEVGSLVVQDEVMEDVPPLWCAAKYGHLDIIKILIRFKASVNKASKTNCTALHAACSSGHFKIVKYLVQHGADPEIPNSFGRTCLMIACSIGHYDISKYLLKNGADVNKIAVNGTTALHECAESGNLEIVKMLLKYGAELLNNSLGFTPLLCAAVKGHSAVMTYLIKKCDCTIPQKVCALQILGTAILAKPGSTACVLDWWTRAMKLQHEVNVLPCEFQPYPRSNLATYVDVTEVYTFHQLQELIFDTNAMWIQASLIRDRLLGPSHQYTLHYLKRAGGQLARFGNFDMAIKLWIYALDQMQKVQEPLSLNIEISLSQLSSLFSHMFQAGLPFSFPDIFLCFQSTVKEIERAMELPKTERSMILNYDNQFEYILVCATNLIKLLCRLQPHLSTTEETEIKKVVYELVQLNPMTHNGRTLLHTVCAKAKLSYYFRAYSAREAVHLLLEVGACPNVLDVNHNTPLHISAESSPSVFEILLDHGAHLDVCNNERVTPLQLLQRKFPLDVYPLHYLNLQCLSAQVIRTNKIPYENFVQKGLKEFVDLH